MRQAGRLAELLHCNRADLAPLEAALEARPVSAAREVRAELRTLTDTVLMYLAALDDAVAHRKDIPRDVSQWFGANANKLEMANDHARYFGLGVNYRTDNKARALAAARKRASR